MPPPGPPCPSEVSPWLSPKCPVTAPLGPPVSLIVPMGAPCAPGPPMSPRDVPKFVPHVPERCHPRAPQYAPEMSPWVSPESPAATPPCPPMSPGVSPASLGGARRGPPMSSTRPQVVPCHPPGPPCPPLSPRLSPPRRAMPAGGGLLCGATGLGLLLAAAATDFWVQRGGAGGSGASASLGLWRGCLGGHCHPHPSTPALWEATRVLMLLSVFTAAAGLALGFSVAASAARRARARVAGVTLLLAGLFHLCAAAKDPSPESSEVAGT
ncbi:proline-rich protein 36-like isoform X3 [Tyto alba]|uniref:proline-rich protein 36-like isoform X3 n=1 Tax=Tyto alba TaxID=56313 RepID=UPI001C66EB1F|nr:proline-rich protein 36-like isoform X3 [Tyto alba]